MSEVMQILKLFQIRLLSVVKRNYTWQGLINFLSM
jgi:hypothetical protein